MFDLINHNPDVLAAELEYRHHVEPATSVATGRRRHRWLHRRASSPAKAR
jgi:hypothetical protein